jgi:putative hydrolase of the HAD superfamily
MEHIKAIGFDLFDTLITVQHLGLQEAMGRLMGSLQDQGFAVENKTFVPVYRDAARQFREAAHVEGRETHNRFWISAALCRLGHDISPDDGRILLAVEAYFSAFLDHAVLLPETREMLTTLKRRYRLGLLSNFTHAPAAKDIVARLGLMPFLEVTLISGELGYRKPHPRVFRELGRQFALPRHQIAFIGDDLDADINGARQAGLQPIWTTYARVHKTTASTDAVPPPANAVDPAVPTVASWGELLTLLGTA